MLYQIISDGFWKPHHILGSSMNIEHVHTCNFLNVHTLNISKQLSKTNRNFMDSGYSSFCLQQGLWNKIYIFMLALKSGVIYLKILPM